MPDPSDTQRQYDATVRRQEMDWRARYDRVLHSDAIAADIGVGALKTAIFVNAGALVALLAFVGQLWSKQEADRALAARVLDSTTPLLIGLVAGAAAFAAAYFYQSLVTLQFDQNLMAISASGAPSARRQRLLLYFVRVVAGLMLGLALLSLGAFVWGVLSVKHAFTAPQPDVINQTVLFAWLNVGGLALGMLGVVLIFFWGPPQPAFGTSPAIGQEDANVLENGKTVAQTKNEMETRKRHHRVISSIGLVLIFLGFTCQLVASWPQ